MSAGLSSSKQAKDAIVLENTMRKRADKLIRTTLRAPLSSKHAVFIMASDRHVCYVMSGGRGEELKNCAGPYVLLGLRSSLLVQRYKHPLSCGKY